MSVGTTGTAGRSSDPIIRVYHASKSYLPGTFALHDLTLEVHRGEFVFLTGPSGAGKTTAEFELISGIQSGQYRLIVAFGLFAGLVIEAAKQLGTGIDFQVGDAEALPFPDKHFDALISTFGVMFARDPEAVAKELARVVRPGGRISLANWAIGGSVHAMFQMIRSYKPAEADPAPSPFEWGSANRVTELLGDSFDIQFESGTSFFQPESGEKAWATFSTGFGPVVTLLEVLSEEKAEALKNEFIDFHEAHRMGSGIVLRRPYIVTKATRIHEGKRAS